MKKLAEYLGLTVAVIIMAAAVFTYLAPHLGWRVDAVVSGSMEPQLGVGSVVVVQPVEPDTIVAGDIITFRLSEAGEIFITHRVTGVGHNSPLYYQTKGDANDKPDPFTVPAGNLVGKVYLHIPFLGYFTEFLKTIYGFVIAVVIPAIIFTVLYVWSVWREIARNRDDRVKVTER